MARGDVQRLPGRGRAHGRGGAQVCLQLPQHRGHAAARPRAAHRVASAPGCRRAPVGPPRSATARPFYAAAQLFLNPANGRFAHPQRLVDVVEVRAGSSVSRAQVCMRTRASFLIGPCCLHVLAQACARGQRRGLADKRHRALPQLRPRPPMLHAAAQGTLQLSYLFPASFLYVLS